MKNQKNERGITLVALVVTIVVLLILAGITIMYVMSDNGVFGQAKNAGEKSDTAAVEEAVSTAFSALYAEIYTKTLAEGETQLDLKQTFEDNMPKVMTLSGDYTVTATPGSVNSLKLEGLKITYKGKTYGIVYDREEVNTGTAGVIATVE